MPDAPPSSPLVELAVVMPVYNEESCIARVLNDWREALAVIPVRFLIIVVNDGSQDGTPRALEPFETDRRFRIIHQPNAGHGPAILTGYNLAIREADWIFQCDSDDEISSSNFAQFWAIREHYDALFGVRTRRRQNWDRWLITRAAGLFVRLLFGKGVLDVNVPFRLFRGSLLKPLLPMIPPGSFTPNLILAGAVTQTGGRIANIPVCHVNRRTGKPSLANVKLWKTALRSLWQIWVLAHLFRKRIQKT